MKAEMELQLMAYLDGELTERETRPVSEALAHDPAVRALAAELTTTKQWLAGNEPVVAVPETREFYWSKIERALEQDERTAAPAAGQPPWRHWLKYLVPVAGVALAAGLAVVLMQPAPPTADEEAARYLTETENLSEHTTSFAFQSQQENMFVVWISSREPSAGSEPEVEPPAYHEVMYQ